MNNNIQPNQGQQYGGTSPGQVPPSSRRMHPLMTTAAVAVIIASLTAGLLVVGLDGAVQIINPAGRRMLDLPGE